MAGKSVSQSKDSQLAPRISNPCESLHFHGVFLSNPYMEHIEELALETALLSP